MASPVCRPACPSTDRLRGRPGFGRMGSGARWAGCGRFQCAVWPWLFGEALGRESQGGPPQGSIALIARVCANERFHVCACIVCDFPDRCCVISACTDFSHSLLNYSGTMVSVGWFFFCSTGVKMGVCESHLSASGCRRGRSSRGWTDLLCANSKLHWAALH